MNNLTYGDLYETTVNSPELTGLSIGILVFGLILVLIMMISYWKVFIKANRPGWAILIPIYNIITMIQVAELSLVYFVLLLIPFVNIYAYFKINISIAKRFNKSTGFGIGISLLPIIFIPILAFSDNDVKEDNPKTSNEFNAMDVIQNNNQVEPINLEPQNNEISNDNIVQDNSNQTDTLNASSNIVIDNLQTINQNAEESVVPQMDTVISNDISNNNVDISNETNDLNVQNNIEMNNLQTINQNVIENNNIEPQVYDTVSNDISNNIDVDKNIQESMVSPVDTVNNDDSANNTLEKTNNNVTNEQPLNAFNSKPINYTNSTNVINTINNEIDNSNNIENINTNQSENDKKICKSCGTEMPNIVSICPNCGVENE